MRKFLLSGALLIGAMATVSAQELAFQKDGVSFENGATLEYGEVEIDDEIPGLFYITIDPQLYLVSDVDATVTVVATCVSGQQIQLCAGGECEKGTKVTKNAVALTANVPLILQFDYSAEIEGTTYEVPDIVATLEAWYNDDPTNKVLLNVHMGDFDAGVESLSLGDASVVLNGRQLDYNVANASQLDVYSLSGETLLSKSVSGNGSISLDALSNGVYLYRLSGKSSKSGKIIIR